MSLNLECRRYGEYQVFVEIKKYPIFEKLQILKVLKIFEFFDFWPLFSSN